jgi:hypothetical protein
MTFGLFSKLIFFVLRVILHTILQKEVLSRCVKTGRSEEFRGATLTWRKDTTNLTGAPQGMIVRIDGDD